MSQRRKPHDPINSHTIPRMQLKRFASSTRKKEVYIWHFRRGCEPHIANTKKVASGSYFYGEPSNGVERALHTIETRHDLMLDDVLRDGSLEKYAEFLRELVWTLAVRTASFRSHVGSLLSSGVNALQSEAEPSQIHRRFENFKDSEFDTVLDDTIKMLPEVPARAFAVSLDRRAGLRDKLRELVAIQLSGLSSDDLRQFLERVLGQIDVEAISKQGHQTAMHKLMETGWVSDSFRPQYWKLIRGEIHSFVLGDIACFAVNRSGKTGHLFRFVKDWQEIYLPVSHDACLVAMASDQVPSLSSVQINETSVSLSFEEFFASRNSQHEQRLHARIRTGTATLTDYEIAAITRDVWSSEE